MACEDLNHELPIDSRLKDARNEDVSALGECMAQVDTATVAVDRRNNHTLQRVKPILTVCLHLEPYHKPYYLFSNLKNNNWYAK